MKPQLYARFRRERARAVAVQSYETRLLVWVVLAVVLWGLSFGVTYDGRHYHARLTFWAVEIVEHESAEH